MMRVEHALTDIRILKLAELYERAYERFILELTERYVKDPGVRGEVERLVSETDEHGARIATLLRELSSEATHGSFEVERAAILDILAVERAARDFYVKHLEDVHDPRVAALFRDLAREETHHVGIAEGALALADRTSRVRFSAPRGRPSR